ncbi:PREDICTED: avidin-like [Cariama cristata]|uniref:avidin-like n=1 Tax=Cariama cristata TaxID=54380 RepID=UPI0005201C22|nr:PREDICTED: avidin-like [Cariama cristata]
MGSGAFILVLTLALAGCVVPAERKCLLSGSWRSDTGCRMVVSVLGKGGRFSGSYLPGPAAGNSEILTSPLEGSQQNTGLVLQPTFSFTVHWRLRDNTTVFYFRSPMYYRLVLGQQLQVTSVALCILISNYKKRKNSKDRVLDLPVTVGSSWVKRSSGSLGMLVGCLPQPGQSCDLILL